MASKSSVESVKDSLVEIDESIEEPLETTEDLVTKINHTANINILLIFEASCSIFFQF